MGNLKVWLGLRTGRVEGTGGGTGALLITDLHPLCHHPPLQGLETSYVLRPPKRVEVKKHYFSYLLQVLLCLLRD